jgi:hypothetical protein
MERRRKNPVAFTRPGWQNLNQAFKIEKTQRVAPFRFLQQQFLKQHCQQSAPKSASGQFGPDCSAKACQA